ncbi:MAG: hypothetical protein ACK5LN_00925 [Propioniciclava sp.]
MDRDVFIEELKVVPKGRGVRRSSLHSWLGPNLKAAAGIDNSMSDEDARHALVALLKRSTETLPVDLRWVLFTAVGVSVDTRRLGDRYAEIQKCLQCSSRTVRRKLREAETMVADVLAHAGSSSEGSMASEGWQWVRQHYEVALDEHARLRLRRRLRVLADRRTVLEEALLLPSTEEGSQDVRFTAGEGLSSLEATQVSPRQWTIRMALAGELRRGEEADTTLEVWVREARSLPAFMAVMPVRPLPEVSVRVDFGSPAAAGSAWRIEGQLPVDLHVRRPGAPSIDPDAPALIQAFPHPQPGFAYGVAWEWAD